MKASNCTQSILIILPIIILNKEESADLKLVWAMTVLDLVRPTVWYGMSCLMVGSFLLDQIIQAATLLSDD